MPSQSVSVAAVLTLCSSQSPLKRYVLHGILPVRKSDPVILQMTTLFPVSGAFTHCESP